MGYLKLNIFAQTSKDELVKGIEDLRKQGAQKLIFDLRDNGGGLLDAAIDVASQFVDGVVVSEKHRDGSQQDFKAEATGAARDLPLVVLVNGGTASASEIVSGALQDRGRAVLVGQKTYGKGSVQNVVPLSDGSSVHVTVAEWLTPKGRQITGKGLEPDDRRRTDAGRCEQRARSPTRSSDHGLSVTRGESSQTVNHGLRRVRDN